MSYRVRFEGAALVQLNGLPAAAFDALVARVVDLISEPWDASVMPPGDDPAFRMTVFDAGNGLLSFYSDDIAEIIRISISPGSADVRSPSLRYGQPSPGLPPSVSTCLRVRFG